MVEKTPRSIDEVGLPMYEHVIGNPNRTKDVYNRLVVKLITEREIRRMSPEQVLSDILVLNRATMEMAISERVSYMLEINYSVGLQALLRSNGYNPQNEGHALIFDTLSKGYLQQQRILQEHIPLQPLAPADSRR